MTLVQADMQNRNRMSIFINFRLFSLLDRKNGIAAYLLLFPVLYSELLSALHTYTYVCILYFNH